MKIPFFSFLIALLSVTALAAKTPQRSVIVSYADDTPHNVIQEAMDAIKAAGGMITHEYHLIKAFAAMAPEKVLGTIQTMGDQYQATVEDDQLVHASNNGF